MRCRRPRRNRRRSGTPIAWRWWIVLRPRHPSSTADGPLSARRRNGTAPLSHRCRHIRSASPLGRPETLGPAGTICQSLQPIRFGPTVKWFVHGGVLFGCRANCFASVGRRFALTGGAAAPMRGGDHQYRPAGALNPGRRRWASLRSSQRAPPCPPGGQSCRMETRAGQQGQRACRSQPAAVGLVAPSFCDDRCYRPA